MRSQELTYITILVQINKRSREKIGYIVVPVTLKYTTIETF